MDDGEKGVVREEGGKKAGGEGRKARERERKESAWRIISRIALLIESGLL